MQSQIIKLINDHPDDWELMLKLLGIRTKMSGNLAIFNYGMDVDFTNPIVREARGIIIDIKEMRVVCWPFTKFCNTHEEAAQIDLRNFDWDNCRVEDKIDGSIIKAYYYGDKWNFATNSCIHADEASVSNSSRTYLDVIKSAVNYDDWMNCTKDTDYTYIFELISPETQVVIKYPFPMLYHIGTRNNRTGEEIRINIGIQQPKTYDIHGLDDCMEAAQNLNHEGEEVRLEGFVVVDNNWHRVKIKSPEYLMAHHVWNNGNISKDKVIEFLRDHDVAEFKTDFPAILTLLKYYDYQLTKLKYEVGKYIDYVRGLYEEYCHDRKAVAMQIKKHKYSGFGFTAIGNTLTADDLVGDMPTSKICKFIPDYEEEAIF